MSVLEISAVLGNFGEFIGALLLFISLIYVGIQIRQNTADSRTNTEMSLYGFFTQINQLQATHPAVLEVFNQAMVDVTQLDDGQRRQFTWLLAAYFYSFDAMYHQLNRSQLSTGTWPVADKVVRGFFASPAVQKWWESGFFNGSPEFMTYVDAIHAETKHGEWRWVDIARVYDESS